jgi:hypothetical protein
MTMSARARDDRPCVTVTVTGCVRRDAPMPVKRGLQVCMCDVKPYDDQLSEHIRRTLLERELGIPIYIGCPCGLAGRVCATASPSM